MQTVANGYCIWMQKFACHAIEDANSKGNIYPLFAIKNTRTEGITWYTVFELAADKTVLYQLPPADILMVGYWLCEAGIKLEKKYVEEQENHLCRG